MAIQISYPTATNVTLSDRLLGTQYDPETGSAITKNFSIGSIVNLANPTQLPYKSYTATFTQSGITAPVATILENNLGGDLTWTYDGVGIYRISSSGLFTEGKTTVTCSNLFGDWTIQPYPLFEESTFPNFIKIINVNSDGGEQVNVIEIACIEIRVYN